MPPRRSTTRRATPAPLASIRPPRAVSVTPRAKSDKSAQQALPISVDAARQPIRFRDLPESVSCGGCDERWMDLAAAHCRACHRTWPAVAGFDEHLPECPAEPTIAPRRPKRMPDGRKPGSDTKRSAGQADDEQNVA